MILECIKRWSDVFGVNPNTLEESNYLINF